jgi:hypothetical protein
MLKMPTIRVKGWCLIIIPGDHPPPHVHARLGSGHGREVTLLLNQDIDIRRADARLSNSEVRAVSRIVHENRELLLRLWETYHS